MAEKRKGKFNIIDGIIILVIIVLICGAVYKFRGLDKTKKNTAMTPITYEFTIESLRNYAFENLQVGDTVYDYTSGNAIGTISNIEWKDAVDPFYTIDGQTVEAPVENRYDAVVTVEAQASESDGVYFVDRTYEICVNSQRKIYTKYVDCTAVITGINK